MGKIVLDTLDDRREIWHLLHRLHPYRRIRFLAWCCRLAARSGNGRGGQPVVSHRMESRVDAAVRDDAQDYVLTHEIYTDFWCLVHQYGMDESVAAGELASLARERRPQIIRPHFLQPPQPA